MYAVFLASATHKPNLDFAVCIVMVIWYAIFEKLLSDLKCKVLFCKMVK